MSITYIEAIGAGFPGVFCSAPGDGSIYEDIIWEGGAELPSKATLDAWIANQKKLDIWTKIQAERDRRTQAGVKVTYNTTDYWFHSDQPSRIQQLGLVIMGTNMPTGIMWKTMSGAFVEMTPTLASMIFQAVAAKDIETFTVAEIHKAQMYASENPESYNYLTGSPAWPLVYGE